MAEVTQAEIEELYSFIHPLAIEAGEILMEGYEMASKNVSIKGDFYDVVTDYDNKIEDFFMAKILASYPGHKFIGEEATAKNNNVSGELTDAPTWIIDPIDGTNNYVRKIPHCCISVGLTINKELVLGIVYNPPANELYSAWQGHGAFLNDQPIEVSNVKEVCVGRVMK